MEQNCILCGKKYGTGLHIMGCFLCFRCEQALLKPGAARRLPPVKRRRLAGLVRTRMEPAHAAQ